jgi:hypothetical protein
VPPPEVGPRQKGHTLFLGRQGHRMHLGTAERAVDQNTMAHIGHVGKLGDVVRKVVDLVLPACSLVGLDLGVHGGSLPLRANGGSRA